ncbi:Rad52/22 family double-strand break repair protein-domain-containing protein [Dendryphion nanum]|uniref:Rad52/22 family double-strand break repair protein-domain-containing protein n=1 Tax=Dendryphion nanum TaxID=256645 RepID=A0A9P9DHZ1_9PLEO|nr:Rad52/22 family double-strand break repair protein-domain-containing protein [Dendryphion nanum]
MTSADNGTVARPAVAATPAVLEQFAVDVDKAHDDVIESANQRFGYNGWSSSIRNMKVDSVDIDEQTGRVSVKISATVRLTLAKGTFHEAIGNGYVKDGDSKAAAYEMAKKSATTDALIGALRYFSNPTMKASLPDASECLAIKESLIEEYMAKED